MPNLIDLTDQNYGRLRVIRRSYQKSKRGTFWECECICGNKTVVNGSSLRRRATSSCGCLRIERVKQSFTIDMTGKRCGRLTVLRQHGTDKNRNATWECICDCGNTIVTAGYYLRTHGTRSCGCLSRELAARICEYHWIKILSLLPEKGKFNAEL